LSVGSANVADVTEYEDEPEELEEGGEPACWLHRLCPECDAVQDEARPARCWRCGAALGGEPEAPDLR
jgi:uncharacterized paraquat-inducible protein A